MKRMITAMLAALVAGGMTAPAFAAYAPTRQVEDLSYAYEGNGEEAEGQTVDLGHVFAPGDITREIPLVYALFDEDPPEGKEWSDTLDEEDMADVGVKMSEAAGEGLVTAGVDKKNGVIRLSFGEEYDGGDDIPFETKIYLTVAGERFEDLGLTFTGTFVPGGDGEPVGDPSVPGNSTKPAGGNPDTGDVSFLGIALATMALSAIAVGAAAVRKRGK